MVLPCPCASEPGFTPASCAQTYILVDSSHAIQFQGIRARAANYLRAQFALFERRQVA